MLHVFIFFKALFYALKKSRMAHILHRQQHGKDRLGSSDWRNIDRYSFVVKGFKSKFWFWEISVVMVRFHILKSNATNKTTFWNLMLLLVCNRSKSCS